MSTLAAALSSRRMRFWITSISALVFVAGVIAFLIGYFGNTAPASKRKEVFSNEPAQIAAKEKRVPLSPEVRIVAGNFIQTAVARKKLAESWRLVGPPLTDGYTLKTWTKGNIPVVPFLAEVGQVRMKVDLSYAKYALLEVLLLPESPKVKPAMFFIELRKFGNDWRVTSWAPRANIATPSTLE